MKITASPDSPCILYNCDEKKERNCYNEKDIKYLIFDERDLFKDLLLSDACKKKNGTINLSEISRQTSRGINTIKEKLSDLKV